MNLDTITCSDALEYAKTLPDECVDCVVTSPPYFGLRDYGVDGQIGLEETPQAFIARLVELFTEIRRALKKTGVMWVNMGDSYAAPTKGSIGNGTSTLKGNDQHTSFPAQLGKNKEFGIAHKNLLMIPARLAIAMQDSGWILRSECVWVKPNPMPESVTDRPTKAHEMVYLFAKSQRYFYDADEIREKGSENSHGGGLVGNHRKDTQLGRFQRGLMEAKVTGDRNHRDVFTVQTEATTFAHFATFPQALIEPFILAGCPEKVCAACGSPYVREVEVTHENYKTFNHPLRTGELMSGGVGKNFPDTTRIDKGIRAACTCNTETRAGVVFDPFMGSGTTAIVARRLGRHFIGSELNAEYAALAIERLRHNDKQELAAALQGKPTTRPMFTD